MIDVSLTDFVDFVVTAGTSRLAKVRAIKKRGEYHPNFDHWKELRDGIVEYHEKGSNDKGFFDNLLKDITDEKKRPTYTLAIKNYKRFLGRKEITNIGRGKKAEWIHGELKVRVNPELRLQIKDDDCIIKLYFKDSKLTKKKIDIILYLIAITLSERATAATRYCVLDIQNETLHKDSKPQDFLLLLLETEAEAFVSLHTRLQI